MSKNGNYGSIRRLNWVQPKFDEKVTKSIPHSEAGDVSRGNGNPPTRGGHTALRPAVRTDYGPELYLGKAVRQAIKYGPGGAQFQRKRDSTGKFAPAQDAGAQSTAEEDQVDQQRDAKLRRHRQLDQLQGRGNPSVGQSNAKKSMIPGVSGADVPENSVNDGSSQMIGTTTSGMPIYDDPYHSAHQQFGQQEHQEAADASSQMAQQKQAAGDMAGAAQSQAAAQAHQQQGIDGTSPGNRFMDNLFGQQGTPEVQPEDMGQFSDLLGMGSDPVEDSNPAIAGNGPEAMMGQDPMMDNSMEGQPPMGQDPMMDPMMDPMEQDPMMGGQDPMAQDPMMDPMEQDPMMDPMAQDPMMDPMAQDPMMDPMAQDPMAQDLMAQDPMAQDLMAPASPSPMAQDPGLNPMGSGTPPQADSLSSFLGQPSMEPGMDQNKPLMPDPMEPGPKPGMVDSTTGTPIGQQTDIAESSAGPTYDLDAFFQEVYGDGSFNAGDDPDYDDSFMEGDVGDEQPGSEPMMGDDMGGEEELEVPESNGGFPGPDSGYNEEPSFGGGEEEEEDYSEEEATLKALRALARYV
jgi:hypothetical protein